MAGRWRASLVDAAGDGVAEGAGEGEPHWRYLIWIALTGVVKRVGGDLARIKLASVVCFCGIVREWSSGFVVNTQGGRRVGADRPGEQATIASKDQRI